MGKKKASHKDLNGLYLQMLIRLKTCPQHMLAHKFEELAKRVGGSKVLWYHVQRNRKHGSEITERLLAEGVMIPQAA